MNDEERKARDSFALKEILDKQRTRKTKTNNQIFYSASMMTSKTAHVKSSSMLRRSISDSVERNVHRAATLHEACREGLYEEVKRLLEDNENPPINNLDDSGFAPLHYAARYQRTQIVSLLIDNGGDINVGSSYDQRNLTPLHMASRFDALGVMKVLIDNGADMEKQSVFGQHALHYAVQRASVELIELLLDKGKVNPHVTDNENFTALHVAALCGRLDVINVLLLHEADPCKIDCDKCTPIHYAAKEGRADILRVLLKTGKTGYAPEGRADILRVLLKTASMAGKSCQDILNTDCRETNSSLHLAVQYGHVEAAKVCIEYGADPSAPQESLETPLHVACNNDYIDMASLLVFHGADIEAKDKDGMTPILRASLSGQVEIIDLLLNEGAKLYPAPGSDMPVPLLCAVNRGHHDAVAFLLKRGSPIDLRDTKYRTCLHIAVYSADIKTVQVILQNGGERLLDARDKDDKTPLHYAAARGDIQILNKLLCAGSLVDLRDEDEKIPLHYASENGNLECVHVLLKKKLSSVDCQDSRLRTPLNYAAAGANHVVARYLINKGADVDNRDDNHVSSLIEAAKCGCLITARVLLEKGASINAVDKDRNTALTTAASNGNALFVSMVLDRGADVSIVTANGDNCLTAAITAGHKDVCMTIVKHERWEEACQFEDPNGYPAIKSLIKKFPDVAKVVLDKCISSSGHQENDEKMEVTHRFDYLDPEPNRRTISSGKKFFAPKYMLESVHKDLLFHPLTLELIRYKWKLFGLRFFYAAAILHVIFLITLGQYVSCQRLLYNERHINQTRNSTEDEEPQHYCSAHVIAGFELGIVAISLFNLCIEGYQMYTERWNYIETSNVVELTTFSCSLIAISMRLNREEDEFYWSLTVISVLLAYLTMLLQFQTLFQSGIYVTMLFEVLKTVVKVVSLFTIIFIVFAVTFHLLLSKKNNRAFLGLPYENGTDITKDPFGTIPLSLVKVIVMTIGEIEYSSFFIDEPLWMTDTARNVFLMFDIILPIVLMNLMNPLNKAWGVVRTLEKSSVGKAQQIGLAVGDIDSIQKNAELKRLTIQIDCIYEFEEKLPFWLLKRFHRSKVVLKPNQKPRTLLQKLKGRLNKRLFSTTNKAPETDLSEVWQKMTEELDNKLQIQEERMQYLNSELSHQKEILEKILLTINPADHD